MPTFDLWQSRELCSPFAPVVVTSDGNDLPGYVRIGRVESEAATPQEIGEIYCSEVPDHLDLASYYELGIQRILTVLQAATCDRTGVRLQQLSWARDALSALLKHQGIGEHSGTTKAH